MLIVANGSRPLELEPPHPRHLQPGGQLAAKAGGEQLPARLSFAGRLAR